MSSDAIYKPQQSGPTGVYPSMVRYKCRIDGIIVFKVLHLTSDLQHDYGLVTRLQQEEDIESYFGGDELIIKHITKRYELKDKLKEFLDG